MSPAWASAESSSSTGTPKPSSTGMLHKAQARAAWAPCKRRAWASLPWVPPLVLAKRKRDCADCYNFSIKATNKSKLVASWAAATRLYITNQAL